MRVPDEIRKCVVFLGAKEVAPDGQENLRLYGTGFFVQLPSSLENWAYTHIVTARHVAEKLDGKPFFVRLNTTNGSSGLVWGDQTARWWYHPDDPSVDVAVFPWAPPSIVEHKRVPISMFLTDDIIREKNIGTGDEVFITGLFAHVTGSKQNLPIVRMGSIAMMPPEPVPTTLGPIDAYLIEARSIGGLSGSPAFVRETVSIGLGPFHLLGLMHGHWDIPPSTKNDEVRVDVFAGIGAVNMGIAIVVPAIKILEVLNQPLLEAIRSVEEQLEQKRRQSTPPIPDEPPRGNEAHGAAVGG